ncbi:MAG: DUF2062 domain-containing protein [Hyphomicrobiaceae bacterium]
MLFQSRQTATLAQRARLLVWPRRSFSRSGRYVTKRMLRMKASPHKIAIGFAAGVFASITPLVGVQMVMAGAIAVILRGSIPAAMLATFVGNPVSWPLIWGATYAVGSVIIGQPGAAEAAAVLMPSNDPIWPILFAMLLGSIPIGLVSGAVSYGVVAQVMTAAQQHKTTHLTLLQNRLAAFSRPCWRLW